jgi:hypothetical protein
MPEWMHNRAMHILAKNPEMGKSQAFAIATQQSHATGHTPKSYGTSEGKQEAKAKYDDPKSTYESTSDPGKVGKKLEKAEDKGKVSIKQAGFDYGHNYYGTKESEIPTSDTPPKTKTKKASLMLPFPLNGTMIKAFSDELQKIAAGAEAPGSPAGLSEIKSTIPTKPLSGKTPRYTKVNSMPSPSPLVGQQPLSEPPAVRT